MTADSFEAGGLILVCFQVCGVFEIIEIVCEVDGGHYSPASASVGVSGKDTALFFQQVSTSPFAELIRTM